MAYRGVFPIDSFIIFDAGFNIISGNHPFKDYWINYWTSFRLYSVTLSF